jgi:hypothetical protein
MPGMWLASLPALQVGQGDVANAKAKSKTM